MYIIGEVFTNLDNYEKTIWPCIFAAVPKIGSSIEGNSGEKLKVVDITHCVVDITNGTEAHIMKIVTWDAARAIAWDATALDAAKDISGKLQKVPYPYVKIEVNN